MRCPLEAPYTGLSTVIEKHETYLFIELYSGNHQNVFLDRLKPEINSQKYLCLVPNQMATTDNDTHRDELSAEKNNPDKNFQK